MTSGGGWWQHNEKRKADGLLPETLDNDNPNHIQIVTDYAQKHAEKWARLARCHCRLPPSHLCRFGLQGVSFRQVR